MNRIFYAVALTIGLSLLGGCKTTEPVSAAVVDQSESMTYLEAGLRPEVLLFPEYLLLEGFELQQHGRIPESNLIGAGLSADLPLQTVRRQFSDILDAYGWELEDTELSGSSFRQIFRLKDEWLELRAVQGTGKAQIFILYRPSATRDEPKEIHP